MFSVRVTLCEKNDENLKLSHSLMELKFCNSNQHSAGVAAVHCCLFKLTFFAGFKVVSVIFSCDCLLVVQVYELA